MSDVNINPEKYEPLSWGEKISKGDLEYLYCECYKSLKDIGRIFDCSIHKVRMNMEYWGIERRDPSRKTKSYYIDDILTEDFLKRKILLVRRKYESFRNCF